MQSTGTASKSPRAIMGVPPVLSRPDQYIARSNWYWDSPFSGALDEVRIWSVARTSPQVISDRSGPLSGSEPGLEAYYQFEEGSGTIAHDLTANHLDAVLATTGSNLPSWGSPGSGQAIDLAGDGVTYAAPLERHGPNNFQNYPVVVTTPDGKLRGWLGGSQPNSSYHIEFFASSGYAPDRSGEAELYLGSLDVTTDASGQAFFNVPYNPPSNKPFISATATDPQGNTSEISPARRLELFASSPEMRFQNVGPVVFSAAAGRLIQVQDPDAGPLPAADELTLTVTQGTLTLAGTGGLSGSGNGTASLDYRGLPADLNAALNGLRFDPPNAIASVVTLTVTFVAPGVLTQTATILIRSGLWLVTNTSDGGEGSLRRCSSRRLPTPAQTESPLRFLDRE